LTDSDVLIVLVLILNLMSASANGRAPISSTIFHNEAL
jgi:hypothetical protein